MIINTKAHPNKSVYKAQFEEINNVDKYSFGIISNTKTDIVGSPLWCDVTSLQASVVLQSFPSYYEQLESDFNPTISIATTKLDENGKATRLYVGLRNERGLNNFFEFSYYYDDLGVQDSEIGSGYIQEKELFSSIISIELSSESYPSFTEVNSPSELTQEGLFYCDKINGTLKFVGKQLENVNINYAIKVGNLQNTIDSLNEAFLEANETGLGIKATIRDNFIIITGIDETFGITSNSSYLRIDCFSRIYVKAGSAIMPSGVKVTIDKDVIMNFEAQDISGKVLFVTLATDYETTSKGLDEFNEEQDKTIEVKNGSKCISISESFDETKDNICLSVFKPFSVNNSEYSNDVIDIDSIKEKFAFLRPWYSPFDVKHRALLGTGKKTPNNPHAISFNDIDSDNTLHNKLLKRGVVLSKPEQRQDTCGELKEYTIRRTEIRFDTDNSIFGVNAYEKDYSDIPNLNYREQTHFPYFILPEIPISIVSIEDLEGNVIEEYEWIEHTSIIKVNINEDSVIKDFKIVYYSESTLEPYISNEGNGVELKSIRDNCVVFSEGKDVRNINSLVSFSEVENLEKNYDVFVDKNGEFVKVPSLEVTSNLDLIEGDLASLFSKSRLEVILTNLPNKPVLDCPFTIRGKGSVTEEVEIYQSFGLYTTDSYGRKILTYESMVCPNPFVPNVDEDNGTDSLTITCEKPNQNLVDFYTINKKNFRIEGTSSENYIFKFNNRENKYIYGGVTVDLEIVTDDEETTDKIELYVIHSYGGRQEILEIRNEHISTEGSSTSLSKSRSISVATDKFDGMNSYGEWQLNFNREHLSGFYVKNVSIKLNYGIIEPILYSKTKDGYLKLKMSANDDGTYTVNPFYGTSTSAKDNEDFSVSVDIIGTVDGENLTEKIEFDSKFRNQQGLNSKVTENVFDEVIKYSVSETTTTGKITILAYPVGNINNLCGVFSCNYKRLKVSKLYDTRKVCPNILYENKNLIGLTPLFVKSVCDVLYKERIEAYFEIRNISTDYSSFTAVTFFSKEAFTAELIRPNGTIARRIESSYDESGSIHKIICYDFEYNYKIKTRGQKNTDDTGFVQIHITNGNEEDKALEVTHWDSSWTTLKDLFNSVSALTKIPDSWEGCSNVTSMYRTFNGCHKLKNIPSIWRGLEKVTTLEWAFRNCRSLKSIPENFDTFKNVETMMQCFENCIELEINELSFSGLYSLKETEYYDPVYGEYHTSYGLEKTFNYCKKINKIKSWEGLKSITNLNKTFAHTKIDSLPESWEGLENVTIATDTFTECDFEKLPNSWEGLNNLINATNMFSNCTKLKEIPKYWYGFDKLENMNLTFYGCSNLEAIPSKYDGLNNVYNISSTFENCTNLKSIPSNFEGLEKVLNAYAMFRDCESIETRIDSFRGLSSVTNARSMFENCLSLQEVSSWEGLDLVENLSYMFKNCSNLLSIPNRFSGLGFITTSDMTTVSMFEDCVKLATSIVSYEALSRVTNASSMFKNCKSITNIPSSWNGLGNVTLLSSFCSGCINLEKIPDSWSGLSSVVSIERIFYECSSVITGGEQDIDSEHLGNLTNCQEAFYGMTSWTADASEIYRQMNNL